MNTQYTVHPDSYLVVLDTFHRHNGRQNVLWCRCLCTACGNEKEIRKHFILGVGKHGGTRSCGCMAGRLNSQSHCKISPPGSKKHSLYPTWHGIRDRCLNPNRRSYKRYGGRGVTIHPDWKDNFSAFSTWIDSNLGPRPDGHSLDRIDNSKGYEPGNLRWADDKTQCNNTRSNVYITHDNKTLTLAQWAEVTGINYKTLQGRHKAGRTPETGLFAQDLRGGTGNNSNVR